MEQLPRHPTAGYLVWRLSMKWRAAVDVAVSPLGLTHAQYSVLASLRGMTRSGSSPSQRELADHTGLDPIYISKLARALEGAGLVERIPDTQDSRAVRLTVTAEGMRIVDRAILIVGQMLEELTAPLGGTGSARTRTLMRDLELLIAAPPLAAPAPAPNATTEGKQPNP